MRGPSSNLYSIDEAYSIEPYYPPPGVPVWFHGRPRPIITAERFHEYLQQSEVFHQSQQSPTNPHLTIHRQESRMTSKADTSIITGERVPWAPVRPQRTGYVSDTNLCGTAGVWWAIEGHLHFVPETKVERVTQFLLSGSEPVGGLDEMAIATLLTHPSVEVPTFTPVGVEPYEISLDPSGEGLSVEQGLVEDEAQARHQHALDQGLSDHEAREEGWPSTQPFEVPEEHLVNAANEAYAQSEATAPQPKNLAEALAWNFPGFEEALRNPALGHKAVAAEFVFTSETSVRRWRKANGVEVAK